MKMKSINERLDEITNKITELKARIEMGWNLKPKEFKDYTWRKIKEMVANDTIKLEVGESRDIKLYTGEIVKCYVANLKPFRLIFAINGEYRMNDTDTNAGGYENSKMATEFIPQIVKLLPKDLQNVITNCRLLTQKEVNKYSDDSLSLFQTKTLSKLFTNHYWWWLQEPVDYDSFAIVLSDGYLTNGIANFSHGVCLCLSI